MALRLPHGATARVRSYILRRYDFLIKRYWRLHLRCPRLMRLSHKPIVKLRWPVAKDNFVVSGLDTPRPRKARLAGQMRAG